MSVRTSLIAGLSVALALGACAPQPEPIYAEPVFDKYGNPDCRPPDVPVGGVYTADLPLCPVIGAPGQPRQVGYGDGDAMVPGTDPVPPGTLPEDPDVPVPPEPPEPEEPTGPPNQNQNQNQNTNQNTNTNQNRTGQN